MRLSAMAVMCALVVGGVCPGAARAEDRKNVVEDKVVSVRSVDLRTEEEYAAYLGSLLDLTKPEMTPVARLERFGDSLCRAYAMCDLKRVMYVVHLVDWELTKGEGGAAAVRKIRLRKSSWAVYQADGAGKIETVYVKAGAFPELWDADGGVLVSVSRLDLGAERTTATDETPAPLIEYTVTNTEKRQLWLSGLETLVGGLTGGTFSPSLAGTKKTETPSRYRTRIRIQGLSAKQTLKRPFDVAIAGSAYGERTGPGECDDLTAEAKCGFSKNLSVVAREYVAFGVDVVPHGPAEAVFTTAADGTMTSKVKRHNAFYGVVDFTPMPRRFPMSRYPYVQAGLPVSGAATHAPYVGMGYPIPVPWLREHLPVSGFAGAVFLKQRGPGGVDDRAVRLLWGVEVPIASMTGAIKQVTGK